MDFERVEVQTAIKEALSVSNWLFGEAAAIQWAEGFTFDRKQIARDEQELLDMGGPPNFRRYMRNLQESRKQDRLNSERIVSYQQDPEYDRLKDLAERGIVMMTDSNFVESPPPKMRSKYLRVSTAANKILNGLFEPNMCHVPTWIVLCLATCVAETLGTTQEAYSYS
jgi:hypothetical protein